LKGIPVKHWSNAGQTLVKRWSNTGQTLVKRWSNTNTGACGRGPGEGDTGQTPVKRWSNTGQTVNTGQITSIRRRSTGRPALDQHSRFRDLDDPHNGQTLVKAGEILVKYW
jgi:hypothetical protein